MTRAFFSGDDHVRNIIVEGDIDICNLQEMKQGLDRLLDSEKIDFDVVIDLTRATYIDSAVLELIIKARRKLASHQRNLTVVAVQGAQPYRVMKTCQFDAILDLRSVEASPVASEA